MPDLGPARCPDCGTEVAPALRSCPACHRLIHAESLRRLAAEAEAGARSGDDAAALLAWRQALDLLPLGSRQHATVSARVAEATARLQAAGKALPVPESHPSWVRRAGPFGVVGLLALKLFAKAGALLSVLASFGVYWAAWGWRFALGLVAIFYIHELGHVAALHRLGVAASAPMFVPGLGAFVKHAPLARREDEASVSLAGPLWGLGAALASCAVWYGTGAPIWAAITQWGARINLLNLIPFGPLDGAKAFGAFSRDQRWVVVFVVGLLIYHTDERMLWLLLLVALGRALGPHVAPEPDWSSLATFVFVAAALAGLATLHVPTGAAP